MERERHSIQHNAERRNTIDQGKNFFQEEKKSFVGSVQGINPCDPEVKCSEKIRTIRKNPLGGAAPSEKFRVHLKMEKQDFRNEYIEYNVEIPIRVALRMEYLMGSTKVNLNDTGYLDKLLAALIREEETELKKKEAGREMKEQLRVKKLVVEGEMPPPPDLMHLYKHPVFRVNAMLRRLALHEKYLSQVPPPVGAHITPCEPFEYDGNEFFKHLHRFGTLDYVPRSVLRAARLKRRGKIVRARARLRQKMEANIDDDVNLLYKHTHADDSMSVASSFIEHLSVATDESTPSSDEDDDSSDENMTEEERRKKMAKRRKQEQMERAKKEKEEQELQLMFQMRERELEQKRFERKQEEAERRRKMDLELKVIREVESSIYQKSIKEKEEHRAGLDQNLAAILRELSQTNINEKPVKETDSQKYLRQLYKIPANSNLQEFKPRQNSLMKNYIKETEDVRDMFQYSKEVKQLFEREQAVCEEFLKKINKISAQQTNKYR